jgi:hypothetical protein
MERQFCFSDHILAAKRANPAADTCALEAEIDRALARHYRLSDEALDFIINYDVKYRIGSNLEEGED